MTTVEHFWSIYEKMEFSERKFYEVLSEKPVKLYFDLGKGMLLVKKRKICYIKSSFKFEALKCNTTESVIIRSTRK